MDTNIAYWLHPTSGVSMRGRGKHEPSEESRLQFRCELHERESRAAVPAKQLLQDGLFYIKTIFSLRVGGIFGMR